MRSSILPPRPRRSSMRRGKSLLVLFFRKERLPLQITLFVAFSSEAGPRPRRVIRCRVGTTGVDRSHTGQPRVRPLSCIATAVPASWAAFRASAPPRKGASHRRGVAFLEDGLVPIGVGQGHLAGRIQRLYLLGREVPVHGAQILAQLLLVAGADNDGGHRRPLQ